MSEASGRRGGKVLFVVIDQLRADCLTGALASVAKLPNLRALMAEGVTFASHYSVTSPCGPARASLLTGLYAMNHRSVRNGTPLSRRHANLALEARKAGYEPLLFGYTDTSPDPEGLDPADPELTSYEGLLPGFTEVARLRFDSGSEAWVADLATKGYDLPAEYRALYRAVDPDGQGRLNAPALYRAEDSDTAWLTDEALKALGPRTGKDWFAHLTYFRPHPPLVAPAPWNALHAPDEVPEARLPVDIAAEKAVHPFTEAFFSEPSGFSLHSGFDGRQDAVAAADRQALRAVYLGLAAEVDHHLERLIGWLKDTGQYDDTLIVVTSDHGEMLGDHFMWGKETVYDPSFRVPLIIRDPRHRAAAGRVVEDFTESVDVAPTILDWLGQAQPQSFNGRKLTPFLEGGAPERWRDHAFMELDLGNPVEPTRFQRLLGLDLASANVAMLREKRFKYVHFNGGLPPLLFDMAADPGEMRNLAGDPAYQGEMLRLARRTLDHRMAHADHALARMHITEDGVKAAPAPARGDRAGYGSP